MELTQNYGLDTISQPKRNQYVEGQMNALELYFKGSENALANIPNLEKVLIKINNHEYTPLAKEIISFVNKNKSEIIERKKASLAGNTPLNEVDDLLYQIAKANTSFKDTFILKDIFEGQITIQDGKDYPAIPEEDRPIIEDVRFTDIGKKYMSYNNFEERIKQPRAERVAKYNSVITNKPTPPFLLKNSLSWLKSKLPFWNKK
ncbi:MAG: hypothetical protein WCK98_02400 [bacterium]